MGIQSFKQVAPGDEKLVGIRDALLRSDRLPQVVLHVGASMPDVAKAQDDIQRAGSRRNGREVHGQWLRPRFFAKAVYGHQPNGHQDQDRHRDQAPPEQQGFKGERFDLRGFLFLSGRDAYPLPFPSDCPCPG